MINRISWNSWLFQSVFFIVRQDVAEIGLRNCFYDLVLTYWFIIAQMLSVCRKILFLFAWQWCSGILLRCEICVRKNGISLCFMTRCSAPVFDADFLDYFGTLICLYGSVREKITWIIIYIQYGKYDVLISATLCYKSHVGTISITPYWINMDLFISFHT